MLKFIEEDPGERNSKRARALRKAKIRAAAATYGNAKREGFFSAAPLLPKSSLSRLELRSLSYYHCKTARAFSGYSDYVFWTKLAPQLAHAFPILSHDLIAVGAYHEALETRDRALQKFSLSQGRKSVAWVNEHYDSIPISALIGHAIIQSQLARFIGRRAHRQTLQTQQSLIELPGKDTLELRELIRRQTNRQCHLLDAVPLMRQAVFHPPLLAEGHALLMRNLGDARDRLEPILGTLAYQAQQGCPLQYGLLEQWYVAFADIRSQCESIGWRTLHAAAGMALMEIERLLESYGRASFLFSSNDTETADSKVSSSSLLPRSDRDVIADVADLFEAALDIAATAEKSRRPQLFKFGIDNGLRELVGQAAMGCRHRGIRRRLMRLIGRAKESGGYETYELLAGVVRCIQTIEEGVIDDARSSTDEEEGPGSRDTSQDSVPDHIPAERRIKLHGVAFLVTPRVVRLDFVRWPWSYTDNPDDERRRLESVWIESEGPHGPKTATSEKFEEHLEVDRGDEELAWYVGAGYVSFPSGERQKDGSEVMELIRPQEYFFNLPKV